MCAVMCTTDALNTALFYDHLVFFMFIFFQCFVCALGLAGSSLGVLWSRGNGAVF